VITVNIGPKALQVLGKFGIEIYFAKGNIRQAVEDLIEGKLEKVS